MAETTTTSAKNEEANPNQLHTTNQGRHSFILVEEAQLSEFACPKCSLLLKDPYQVTCCGLIMCKTCLHQLRVSEHDFLCPSCNSSLNKNYFKDTNTEKKILELKVYCQYRENGCKWIGKVREVEAHTWACDHQLVQCPNGCNEIVYPHTLQEHVQETCPQRYVQCPHCSLTDKHRIITGSSHLDVCPELPIPCHNKECKEIIIRKEMHTHSEECSKEIVSCPYSLAGCRIKLPRESITSHSQSNTAAHLDLAMTQLTSMHTDIEELSFRILKLEEGHEELRTRPLNATGASPPTQKLVLRLKPYNAYKNSGKMWQSVPFKTHQPEGYKLRLSVAGNGLGKCEGTHISCYISLMSGEHDDILEWPFEGDVTIELLNQLRDKNHVKHILKFNNKIPIKYRERVTEGVCGIGWGKSSFVSQSELSYNEALNTQYLQNDTLYFRVSISTSSKIKPWLLGIK